jgi:hypothetical protein
MLAGVPVGKFFASDKVKVLAEIVQVALERSDNLGHGDDPLRWLAENA